MFFVHKFKNLQNCTKFFPKNPLGRLWKGVWPPTCAHHGPIPRGSAGNSPGGGSLFRIFVYMCNSRPSTRCGVFWNPVHSNKRGYCVLVCTCEVFSKLSNRLSLLSQLRSRIRPQVSKGGLSTTWAESWATEQNGAIFDVCWAYARIDKVRYWKLVHPNLKIKQMCLIKAARVRVVISTIPS